MRDVASQEQGYEINAVHAVRLRYFKIDAQALLPRVHSS